jgi:hypothetical protein
MQVCVESPPSTVVMPFSQEISHDIVDASMGREIGFEFSRLGMQLPDDTPLAVKEGYREGVHTHGNRYEESTRYDRKLIRLRLSAYKRERAIDSMVTAELLERIDVQYCPITRVKLTSGTGTKTDATVDRVFNDGGYAVGNLAVMSMRANQAKGALSPMAILEIAKRGDVHAGLDMMEWMRLACLTALAAPPNYPVSHLPLFVYPPNGILLTNPFTLIQQCTSSIAAGFLAQKWESELRACLDGKATKKAFDAFIEALVGQLSQTMRGVSDEELKRFAICDGWVGELVFTRYSKFIGQTSEQTIRKLTGVATRAQRSLRKFTPKELDAWMLSTQGYVGEDLE